MPDIMKVGRCITYRSTQGRSRQHPAHLHCHRWNRVPLLLICLAIAQTAGVCAVLLTASHTYLVVRAQSDGVQS